KKEIILTHFDEMIKHYKDQGVSIFRKHLHEYSKGHKDASAFRYKVLVLKILIKVLFIIKTQSFLFLI
ncbi:hypothetical protein VWM73_10780, partial [Campylobacter coli]